MKIIYIANIRLLTDRAHTIQVMKMCEGFAKQGVDVELVVPDRRSAVGNVEAFKYYDVEPVFKIKEISNPDLVGMTMSLSKILYRIDFLFFFLKLFLLKVDGDAVIYCREPYLTIPFLWTRNKKVIEIHDLRLQQPFFWTLLKKASHVVVITRSLKDALVNRGIRSSDVTVSPDGVDIEKFDIPMNKFEARRDLGLDIDTTLVVYTGSQHKWKGVDTLMAASKLLVDVKTILVTGKPYIEIPKYLKAADILVIPNSGKTKISRLFTSPLKLFEYMASGRPIVASDLPSIREILNESNAYFFTPDDAESLADVIKLALGDPDKDRKAQKARQDVEQYTWEKRAAKIIQSIK